MLGRDLRKVIIVDNSPTSYYFQPENAIPIKSWIDDPADVELFKLTEFLENIADVPDVKDYISRMSDVLS